jgi:hypothetical protein
MQRREFVAFLGGAAAALPFPAYAASSPGAVRRIGVLMPLAKNDPIAQRVLDVFMQGLQKLGSHRWSRLAGQIDGTTPSCVTNAASSLRPSP